jgi:hypothetical protein
MIPADIITFNRTHPPYINHSIIISIFVINFIQGISDMGVTIVTMNILIKIGNTKTNYDPP